MPSLSDHPLSRIHAGLISNLSKSAGKMVPMAFIQKIKFHHSNPSLDGLTYWRERILDAVLTAGGGLALLALVPAIFLAFTRQLWALLIGDVIGLILMGYPLFANARA